MTYIIDLNVKSETIKLPEENMRKILCELKFGKEISDMTPETQSIKEKLIKFSLSNYNCLLHEKVKIMQKQAIHW